MRRYYSSWRSLVPCQPSVVISRRPTKSCLLLLAARLPLTKIETGTGAEGNISYSLGLITITTVVLYTHLHSLESWYFNPTLLFRRVTKVSHSRSWTVAAVTPQVNLLRPSTRLDSTTSLTDLRCSLLLVSDGQGWNTDLSSNSLSDALSESSYEARDGPRGTHPPTKARDLRLHHTAVTSLACQQLIHRFCTVAFTGG